MPAVQDILSTINQFAQARLPVMGGWRAMGFAGRADPLVSPEHPDAPESAYAHAGAEPELDEVLDDPVVQLIMHADHVQPTDLQHLLGTAQHRAGPPARGAVLRPQ
jgi:hypothetical protein